MRKVEENLLTKGYSRGWTRTPWAIVLHYTAGYTEPQTHSVLKNRGISVHFCVERDGKLVRYLEDENRGWHAGSSSWCGYSGMNHHAFGVEMVNFGWGDGEFDGSSPRYVYRNKGTPEVMQSDKEFYRDERYKSSKGKLVTTRVVTAQDMDKFPDHRKAWSNKLWAEYPDQQVEAVAWQVWNWMKEYNILPENVIGHEHVSPTRKTDPGPAFPWNQLEIYLRARMVKEKPALLDVNFNRKLRVRAVQSHCARMGLNVGDIDGWWGKKTEAAIKDAVKLYGKTYNIENLLIDPDNLTNIAFALKMIPGFDPGRR
jgi:N-acetyl-anhydromuramyl-L-alanine amidase AmpD